MSNLVRGLLNRGEKRKTIVIIDPGAMEYARLAGILGAVERFSTALTIEI